VGLWLLREAGKREIFGKLIEVGRVGWVAGASREEPKDRGDAGRTKLQRVLSCFRFLDWYFQHISTLSVSTWNLFELTKLA